MSSTRSFAYALLGLSTLALLTSCSSSSVVMSTPVASLAAHGVVHGGQPPVTVSTITLWAVGTTADGSSATSLTSTATDLSGNFTLGAYTCPGSNPDVYITASGGNPGLTLGTNNPNILMMAALTDCNTLKANAATTFIFIDEVTTVGAVAALYPYMTSTGNLSYGPSDASAFATAFSNVSEYTNTTTGSAPGPTLPSGFYASSTEINTLGNILSSCINSPGGVAGDTSSCGNLFNLTKAGSVAPTNILGAMLNIINNPTQNASALFSLPVASAPFQPALTVAPTTFALPILPFAATPTFSITSGTYSSAQFVTLADTTSGAVIHYTTDGSTPTSASPTYSGTISVSSSQTISAIAQAAGFATSSIGTATYTITGSTTTYSIGGQVNLTDVCGTVNVPTFTVTLMHGSTLVQTTTTNSSGNFFFLGVPNSTYTITPFISGPSSVVYPTTLTAVVNGGNLTSELFSANLGYTVSGTVAYSGSQTGRTYISLNTSCNGSSAEGTSIVTKGAYTIHGVPPSAYTLQAFMDNLGTGIANAANPSGSSSVSVTTASLTGQNVTLADPSTVTLSSAPTIQGIAALNSSALIQYKPITSSNLEQPSSYTVQWSTSPTFATVTGSKTFPSNGSKADAWLITGLTDATAYYFRVTATSSGTPAGTFYSAINGPVTIGAPTGGNSISGAVTFSATPTGPLFVGFLSQTTGNFYAEYFPSPASAQAYTIQAPSDTYAFFAILDQNNNGIIDTGDIQDATDNGSGSSGTVTITGSTTNENLTLPSSNAIASVATQSFFFVNPGGNSQSYDLDLQVNGLVKLPVAVTLTSGPNVISPVDIALCSGSVNGCSRGFQALFNTGTTLPTVGDTYGFSVTYSDGTTGTLSASVTAVLNNAYPTGLLPQTGTSTSVTPTFTWNDPANAANYIYIFSLGNTSSQIWQIPNNNSNSNGFASTITSIPWNTDPTGGGSLPSVSTLTLNTVYVWQIQLQDSNGNQATKQVQYVP